MRKYLLPILLSLAPVFAASASTADTELPDVIAQWGVDPKLFTIQCLEDPCSPEKRELVMQKMSAAFARIPPFLKGTQIQMLGWSELPAGAKLDGRAEKDWNSITIRTPINESFDRVLVHEVAHLFDETDHRIPSAYLEIRYGTAEYNAALTKLYAHLRSITKPYEKTIVDQQAKNFMAQNKILRRSAEDVHASNIYEYWAVSVELYYHYHKIGKLSALEEVLSKKEIEFLSKLKW